MIQTTTKTIAKADVDTWLARLIEQADVIAPIAGHGGDVVYSHISSPAGVLWRFGNSLHPPKQFLLPQTDPIVAIRNDDVGYHPEPIRDDRHRILFNIRSCDVKGMAFLTKVHASDLVDDSYMKRRENTALISLACIEPGPDCFCVCTDSGPFSRQDFDVQLTDLGTCLLAEPGSDKGAALLEEAGELFRAAKEEEVSERTRLEEKARGRFEKQTCHFASAMRRISTGRVEEKLWAELSDWCLGCGGCTMVCPTCYCFSVVDRRQDGVWERCRIWDSCQYSPFTLEASGHNPRADRKDRIKRRFFHKVSAQYCRREGMVGCVGCGRCIKVCLGLTDMPTVVAAIRKGVFNG